MLTIDIYMNLSEERHIYITRLYMSLVIIFLPINKNSYKRNFLFKIDN